MGNVVPPQHFPHRYLGEFTAQPTPDVNDKIEVRLHYSKAGFATCSKDWISTASFDDLSLTS
jgi:hypothetical protein